MGFFIASFVVGVIGLSLYIPGLFLERQSRHFEENKRRGRAEVVGYQRAEESQRYLLTVRLLDANDGKTYPCSGRGILPSRYPLGTVVDVQYTPQRVLGVQIMKVQLFDAQPAKGIRIGMVIKRIAIVLLVITLLLTAAGIISLL